MTAADRDPIADAQALGEYWDALTRDAGAPVASLDPAIAETVHRLCALDDARAPDPAFITRLERALLEMTGASIPSSSVAAHSPLADTANGHIRVPPAPLALLRRDRPRRQWLTSLATAALVLLTVIGSLVVFGGPLRPGEQDARPGKVPAVVTALPPGVTQDTVLVHAILDEIPSAVKGVGVKRAVIAPNAEWRQGDAMIGPALYRIEEGIVTVQADAPIEVKRADSSLATSVEAGAASELHAGDTAFVPSNVRSTWRNVGTTPLVILGAAVALQWEVLELPGVTVTRLIDEEPSPPPTAPAELTLRRITLEPGASVPSEASPGLEIVGVEAGTLNILWATRGAGLNPSAPAGGSQVPAGAWADVNKAPLFAAAFANSGTEPVMFLLMTVTPIGANADTSLAAGAIEAGEPVVTGALDRLWMSTGGPDPLRLPYGIGIAPDGNLWIADGGNDRFQILAPDGMFLELWGTAGSGDGQFEFASSESAFATPNGDVAFDTEGNIYVADTGNFRIQKFAPDRSFLLSWGGKGTGHGQFLTPSGIAIDGSGTVYVSDEARHDVQKFDSNGTWLGTIGGPGEEEGQFRIPAGVAVDSGGDVWVADASNHRIQRFDASGKLLASWGHSRSELNWPNDVAVDALGRVYVVNHGSHRLQVFTKSGQLLAEIGRDTPDVALFDLAAVAVDGDGVVFAVSESQVEAFRVVTPASTAPEK